jgi:predicted RNase H-like HicB family nuclease
MSNGDFLSQHQVQVYQDDDGFYHACYPTLGETLFRACGLSRDEAVETLAEAAEMTLEWALETGYPLPTPNSPDSPA